MTTPNPRGFPRQSAEASICESLSAQSNKPRPHWSFDPEADKAQRRANRKTGGSAASRKSRINAATVADAMALLEQMQKELEKQNEKP